MNHRLLQVNENVHRELSRLLLEDYGNEGYFFTLTQVLVTPDLRNATAWISVINSAEPEKLIDLLNKRTFDMYDKLSERLKMKYVPRIEFKLDDKAEELTRVDSLFDQIEE